MDNRSTVQGLLEVAEAHLAGVQPGARLEAVALRFVLDGRRLELVFNPAPGAVEEPRLVPDPEEPLRKLIVDVLRSLPPKPLKGSAVAARCGKQADSYFRSVLAELARGPWVVKVPNKGYLWAGHVNQSQLRLLQEDQGHAV